MFFVCIRNKFYAAYLGSLTIGHPEPRVTVEKVPICARTPDPGIRAEMELTKPNLNYL
jgi:hypothetical protein